MTIAEKKTLEVPAKVKEQAEVHRTSTETAKPDMIATGLPTDPTSMNETRKGDRRSFAGPRNVLQQGGTPNVHSASDSVLQSWGRPARSDQSILNDYFIKGDGIHREILQREICKYLGPQAYSRPHVYNVRHHISKICAFTDFLNRVLKATMSERYGLLLQ